MEPVVQLFPGDMELPDDVYQAVMNAPTGCFGVVAVFVAVARELGITLSDATIEALIRFGAASYFIDQFLDEKPDCNRPRCQCRSMSAREEAFRRIALAADPLAVDIPVWVDPIAPNLRPIWALLMSSLKGVSSRDEVVQDALSIARFPPIQARTRNVFSYIRLLWREDMLTGRAAANCLSDTERAHPNFRILSWYCGQIVNVWAVMDAKDDLSWDLQTGQVSVRNSRFNRGVLRIAFGFAAARLARRLKVLLAILEEKKRYMIAQSVERRSVGPMYVPSGTITERR
jgi:hypothetical protein